MKKLFTILFISLTAAASSQIVATLELKEDVLGICNKKEVYALFPSLAGQKEAVCSKSKDDLLKDLNDIPFIKSADPKFKSKGMVNILVNFKGQVVQCEIDNKTKDPALDKQIVAVFKTLTFTESGKLNGKSVDSSLLYSFKIKKGEITWN